MLVSFDTLYALGPATCVCAVELTDELRATLVKRCRSRRTRTSAFTSRAPTKWDPRSLRDPGDPLNVFTEDRAWDFIAEALEAGVAVQVISLEKPPGAKGYVMLLNGAGTDKIYVKLQLGGGTVLCRSFHRSNASRDE